jgi:hypothetical protein
MPHIGKHAISLTLVFSQKIFSQRLFLRPVVDPINNWDVFA